MCMSVANEVYFTLCFCWKILNEQGGYEKQETKLQWPNIHSLEK